MNKLSKLIKSLPPSDIQVKSTYTFAPGKIIFYYDVKIPNLQIYVGRIRTMDQGRAKTTYKLGITHPNTGTEFIAAKQMAHQVFDTVHAKMGIIR